jgi:hypothetical protein
LCGRATCRWSRSTTWRLTEECTPTDWAWTTLVTW